MIKIIPDLEGKLTQWDKNRQVIVTGLESTEDVEILASMPNDDHGAYVLKFVDGKADIPNILLTINGVMTVSVYKKNRTVFSAVFAVAEHEKPDDYIYAETEVLNYKTLDEKIGDLSKLTTAAKENLVAAINEAATKGTTSVYMRVAEGYIEYSGDGVTWEKLIAVDALKGPKGPKGEKGDKGDPGKDAATDISLGITSAAVGDIVKVKAVDASGKPTEWEAAGWRKIREFTIPDDPSTDTSDISYSMCNMEGCTDKIAQAIFSTDDKGNPFDVQDIFLVANWGYSKTSNYYGMSDQNGNLGYGNIFSNRLSNSALWEITYLSIRINNYRYAFRGGVSNAMDIMGIMHTSPNVKDDLRITTIKIGTFLNQAMLPGSSFIVYGR